MMLWHTPRTNEIPFLPSRRQFLSVATLGAAGTMGLQRISAVPSSSETRTSSATSQSPASIGSQRELFVDRRLIQSIRGGARLQLHHPVPQEIAIQHTNPWEGTGSGYHSIFQDGNLYRMYYKAWHIEVGQGKVKTDGHPLYCCYAKSDDGIQWQKPELGIHDFQGSKKNNIVMASGMHGPLAVDAGHPAVFLDENPRAPAEARYKAIFRSQKPNGLLPFQSPDGIHWSPMTDRPILSKLGAFDSQNLAFWDPTLGKYRAYWRIFTEGITTWKPNSYRAIRTAVSENLVDWSSPIDLTYEDSPQEELYTNQIKPYHRAPHLLIGFPTRYIDRGWSHSMENLPALKNRKARSAGSPRYGTALTESLLMASRDGRHFTRWNEAFLRPGAERPDAWNYGQMYLAWHLVETRSKLPGASPELSLYATESYWHGTGSALRRYTLRLDGFVSVCAPMQGGELLTRPILFDGQSLHLNFSSSAAGQIRVELQRLDGKAIEGFALEDSHALFGDSVDRQVSWKKGADVSALAGQPLQIRFVLNDADLFAYRFQKHS